MLIANSSVLIDNGGVLQMFNAGSNIVLDETDVIRTNFQVGNGGRATFDLNGGNYITPNGGGYYVTGTNSKWEFLDGSGFTINVSAVIVSDGGLLSVAGDVSVGALSTLTIGSATGGGTLTANSLFVNTLQWHLELQ